LSGTLSGTRFSARNVVAVTRAGGGVRLTVATSDPSGRRLTVTLRPLGRDAIDVTASIERPAGVATLGDSFTSTPSEGFFGFGGRHNALDQHGQVLSSFVEEENVDGTTGFEIGGDGRSLYPNGPSAAYDPQAEFVSSRGYGFLLTRPELARFRLDDGRPAWQADVAGNHLSYLVSPARPAQAMAALTAISGRQPVAPAWALAPELDRETQLGQNAAGYLAQVRQDFVDIRRHRLPLRAYRLEGWGILPTATVRGLIAQLHVMGIHALVYFRPFVSQDVAATEAPGVFQYAIAHRLVAKTSSGMPFVFGDSFGGNAALIDFTNPAAVSWWAARLRSALDLGADGFMQDFGEEVLPGMRFHDGETGATMHNRYPLVYARVTRKILDQYMHAHPRRRLLFFTRAGYSGTPGSAAYESANFAGDETTDWTRSSGIASVIPDMLNRALGGAYGYTTDIGGYFDIYTPHATTKELLLRWADPRLVRLGTPVGLVWLELWSPGRYSLQNGGLFLIYIGWALVMRAHPERPKAKATPPTPWDAGAGPAISWPGPLTAAAGREIVTNDCSRYVSIAWRGTRRT